MNGYASTFGGPTSPSNGQIISQTNSPGSLDLYGLIHSDGNLGYLQQRAANPQFAVSSFIYTFVVNNLFYFSREDEMKKYIILSYEITKTTILENGLIGDL